jgi:hypothetical protein
MRGGVGFYLRQVGQDYGVTDEDRQREVSERLERLFGSGKN